jgi:acetylornithine deacetylase/succinyl-diaminopimelate desuccinylase-like protein
MTLSVRVIPNNSVSQNWHLVEAFIKSAEEKFGGAEYTTEQIKVYLVQGQWMLLVAVDEDNEIQGAATVSFINYPNDRVAFVTSIGGKLVTSQDTFKQMSEILKVNGATKIQGVAKEAIARLWKRFGFEEKAILVETKL